MSFLYPLFLAGIAAIGLPILLHMIRRHTRKRITFSSLMFLRTTIPRFKNRSRLENLPLLILRCLILCLLAFGFSRPFFPGKVADEQVSIGRRIVILIDTSASVRRAEAWDRVISEAQSVLENVNLTDRVCVMSFDQSTNTIIGFEQWLSLEPAERASVVIEQISELSPGWASTNLGNALVSAAEAIEEDEVNDERLTVATRQIVLISDLQEGCDVEAMHAYEWPQETELVVKLVRCPGTTNAAMQLVASRNNLSISDAKEPQSIRITNSSNASAERFKLKWAAEMSVNSSAESVYVYVPPGQSIVVHPPARKDNSEFQELVLTGDDHDFDNILYLAPSLQQEVNILYIGSDDPDDSREMLYYIQRAFGTTGLFKPRIISRSGDKNIGITDIETTHLIVLTDTVNQENIVSLRRYLESGRTLLMVMKSAEAVTAMTRLASIDGVESKEADVNRYTMLSRIEYEHPLLTAFAAPHFGDFTQIHFWKYRFIDIQNFSEAQVLAHFDSGDPAWFELPVGRGSLLVFTSGWHPEDSQLALSTKFIPLLYSVLEYSGVFAGQQSQYFVGDRIPVTQLVQYEIEKLQIRKPDDSLIDIDTGQQSYVQAGMPGIYSIESPVGNRLFAVNLPVKECQTAPMQIDKLEQLGISLGQSSDVAVGRTEQIRRRSSFIGLEYEQKVWRWVFMVLLAMSLIEIWLAGWLTGAPSIAQGEQND